MWTFLLLLGSFSLKAQILNEWESYSDPYRMSHQLETRIALLPLKAEVLRGEKYWSGHYWPFNKGNISYRWQRKVVNDELPLNVHEFIKLDKFTINKLSPTEKFDLYNERFDYPLTSEVLNRSNYDAKSWEGICHGWSVASIHHDRPKEKTVKTRSGKEITFYRQDIEALISYYYAYPYYAEDNYQIGQRCFERRGQGNEFCTQDLNAAAFHLILANKIGLEQEGFVADIQAGPQVWNHPIIGYESKILRDKRTKTGRTLNIQTTLKFLDGSGLDPKKSSVTKTRYYLYSLEVSASGIILGGKWHSPSRPDFLWYLQKANNFQSLYKKLSTLI